MVCSKISSIDLSIRLRLLTIECVINLFSIVSLSGWVLDQILSNEIFIDAWTFSLYFEMGLI